MQAQQRSASTSFDTNPLAVWTFVGSLLMCILLGLATNGFAVVVPEFAAFLQGRLSEIGKQPPSFIMMVPIILAVVALEVPSTIVGAVIQGKILGGHSKHSISELLKDMKEGRHFFTFFVVVLAEELFARGLFLGLLTKIPFLGGTVAFYVLAFIGNAIWSLIHLPNFKEEKERHWLRTLPQFIGGVFYVYMFAKYGLLGSILAHFASNALVFSLHKKQKAGTVDGLIIAYNAVCAVVGYFLLTKPLGDVLLWFSDEPTFALPGWDFWDYVKLSLLLQGTFSLVIDLLFYDRTSKEHTKETHNQTFFAWIFNTILALGMLYGIYFLLGFVVPSVPYRIVTLSILLAFVLKTESGSAMSRVFWQGIPGLYITFCPLLALGFWHAVGYMLVRSVITWPETALEIEDD